MDNNYVLTREQLIEQLKNAISTYNIQQHELFNQWISVDERLPEVVYIDCEYRDPFNRVIAWSSDDGEFWYPRLARLTQRTTDDGDAPLIWEDDENLFQIMVTHWMPIPKGLNNEQ